MDIHVPYEHTIRMIPGAKEESESLVWLAICAIKARYIHS